MSAREGIDVCMTDQRRVWLILERMGRRISGDLMETLSEWPSDLRPGFVRVYQWGNTGRQIELGYDIGEPTWDDMDDGKITAGTLVEVNDPPSCEFYTGVADPDLFLGISDDKGPTGSAKLVSTKSALEYVRNQAFNYLSKHLVRLRADGNYKNWVIWRASVRVTGRAYGRAIGELGASFYPKQPRGSCLQIVSTRNKKWSGKGDIKGQFNGMDAWKWHVGRPSLSEYGWLANYRMRLIRRRKHRNRTRKGKGVKIPPTKNKRPAHTRNPHSRSGQSAPRSAQTKAGPFGRAAVFNDRQEREFYGEAWANAEALAREFGAPFKEHAGKWFDPS